MRLGLGRKQLVSADLRISRAWNPGPFAEGGQRCFIRVDGVSGNRGTRPLQSPSRYRDRTVTTSDTQN